LDVPGVGTATLDFRDGAVYSLLNYTLGDPGGDRRLLSFIARAIRPGDVFWDIGANVGTISAFCAHPDRRLKAVHCFEPNPTALRVLQSLFVNNPSVRVFPVAMGDAETAVQINFHPTNTHLGSIVHCPIERCESVGT
jgi:predicted RNA methylase